MSFIGLDSPEKYVSLLLEKAVNIISKNYYGDIDYDKMFFGALSGMIGALDRYSNVIPISKQTDNFAKSRNYITSIVASVQHVDTHCVGIIKIMVFTESTPLELDSKIKELLGLNIEKVIIDLRNNEGGSVDSLIRICNLLVRNREIFYSIDNKGRVYKYKSDLSVPPFKKIVLLVNRETKSAAEMLALVLQEEGAFVIGERTFGKSLAQTDFSLGNAVLRITTKDYCSYINGSYNNSGITPDLNLPEEIIFNDELVLEEACKVICYNY